ncbi:MAG: alginate export family protein [Nitrospirota bacterium]|jgi:hypothetical protein
MKNLQTTLTGKAIVGLGLVAGLILAPAIATAASLEMGLQLRYRGEADARDFNDDTGTDVVNSQRTRLNAKVDHERYHAFLQVQDVRVWGEEDDTLTDASAEGLDMHQAFFKVDDVFDTGIGVQVGRQEINFADQRLIGAVNWTQNARSLDGIVLSRAIGDQGVVIPFLLQLNEEDAIGFGGDLRQANPNVDEGEDEDMWTAGFHSAWTVAEDQTFQPHVYYVRDGMTNLNLYTLGFYYDGKAGDVSYDFTADWQTGDMGDVDISAYLVAANVGFQTGDVVVGAGIDYLSGDDDSSDSDVESFNTLLATNHRFYGYMDYFTNFGSTGDDVKGLGLIDYHAKAWYTFGGPTKAGVDAHYFTTAEDDKARLDGEDALGTELDFGFKTKSGPLDIYAGYSVFFQDEAMEARFDHANNDDIGHWAFVMASINFP